MKQNKWDKLNKELDDALEEEFGSEEPKQETLEEITANLADPNLCKTDNWIAGAKWMLEELQDFDTWKEWKDITFKSE